MRTSHHLNPKLTPGCKRWFLDGKDGDGKTVTNPNTGYGACARKRAGRKTRPFYNNGDSASTTGVSVYIMGIADKMFLAQCFAGKLGKASVTGYCITFRTLIDTNIDAHETTIQYGVEATSAR